MTNIIQVFGESKYTLILASNYLPGFLLFELIELTTNIMFSLSFKLLFAFMAGIFVTEWFYEWISICFKVCTLLTNKQDDYKNFLEIKSPVRILRQFAEVNEEKLIKIQKSNYPQSMALTCAMGSAGWLIMFFSFLTWNGLFYILIGIPILIAGKTFVCSLFKDESEWKGGYYSLFLTILIASIILIFFLEYKYEEQITFILSQNVEIAVDRIYISIISLYFISAGSAYYLNDITKALKDIYPSNE